MSSTMRGYVVVVKSSIVLLDNDNKVEPSNLMQWGVTLTPVRNLALHLQVCRSRSLGILSNTVLAIQQLFRLPHILSGVSAQDLT